MRISSNFRKPQIKPSSSKGSRTTSTSFSQNLSSSEASVTANATGISSIANASALLALQGEEGFGEGRNKSLIRKGYSLIEALENLQTDMLSGRISLTGLSRIKAMVEGLEISDDATLNEIIADISLRVEVELAKLGH